MFKDVFCCIQYSLSRVLYGTITSLAINCFSGCYLFVVPKIHYNKILSGSLLGDHFQTPCGGFRKPPHF